MSLKTALLSRMTERYLSERRQRSVRGRAERRRLSDGRPHIVEYFHQADDPYSHLVAQVLPRLAERYEIEIRPHLVGPPPAWAAPEATRLRDWSLRDAAWLAARADLRFPAACPQLEPSAVAIAERALAGALVAGDFVTRAAAIGAALWHRQTIPDSIDADATAARTAGDRRRETLGHYLGATLWYEGEWYWGIDRLHYLEQRLTELGANRPGAADRPPFLPPSVTSTSAGMRETEPGKRLDWYLSFRSPYTYLAAERIGAIAAAHGADLVLRYVLPMRMRGLPVPKLKSRYIAADVAREARRLGIPFGRIADPLGEPVERGYSLLPWAIEQDRGYEYCLAFMRGVWSEGVDAGTDRGLARIVRRAGLDWERAKGRLGTDEWRAVAEENRRELLEQGLWGVPSFRVGEEVVWGQDRLWVVEDLLRRLPEKLAAPD